MWDSFNTAANQATTFVIIDTKLYVPVVTLSAQDNAKLLEQLKSRFKRTINQNKYQAKVSTEGVNQYWDFLIDPRFQGVNKLFKFIYMKQVKGRLQNWLFARL